MSLEIALPPDLMRPEILLAALAATLAVGLLLGWLLRHAGLAPRIRAAEGRATDLEERLTGAQADLASRSAEVAALAARLDAERAAHEARMADLANVRGQIERNLEVAMARLLDNGADRLVRTTKEIVTAQHERGEAGLKGLLEPMRQSLEQFREQTARIEAQRKRDEGAMVEQLRQVSETHARLQTTTAGLVNALRSAPKTRGRWGEQQLHRLLEMAGMAEHADFQTEHTIATEEGRFRPDVVIRMPGGRSLVVDAKTSLAAYLDAIDSDDEAARERLLADHAKAMRSHAMQLGGKEYWRHLPEDSVDFVVMFVPGEPFYAAAMARDPALFEDAWARQVIVCSPTTFLGLAKAIAYGWRQEQVAADAQKLHALGVELYRRMVRLGGAVADLSRSLDGHVKRHNALIGTLEGSVLPKARQMAELSVAPAHGTVPDLAAIQTEVRQPAAGRDLRVEPEHEDRTGEIRHAKS
ncbi:DNA recombination protein RmuC [Marinibaculum pumilum]|uniref:DNA recombination protein RmuC homolog n=1 Tax=Marinibaculum pumilum TaxID=1766165 RepID=A0ABV7KVZ6_9PROT